MFAFLGALTGLTLDIIVLANNGTDQHHFLAWAVFAIAVGIVVEFLSAHR